MNTPPSPTHETHISDKGSLLEALLYICAEEGRKATRSPLTAGFPLVNGRLTQKKSFKISS
ncbi:MAG: hypothetical protein K6L80_16605 [Agarilytica sp.]